MYDYFKPRGPIKSSEPDAGNANIRSVPVFGVVKDNVDPVRMGRIQVYLLDLNGQDQDNADSWITVGQLPNFYGYTQPRAGKEKDDFGTYERNPHSYGAWQSPPEIGTVVICMFVNGDPNFGYYIGCVPNPDALQMVPAIGATSNVVLNNTEASSYGGATRLPVTNINPNNPKSNDPDYFTMAKPVHSYTAAIMNQQGIIRDPIRGPISTSAQRESPSRVGWGVSTPGRPIYEGNYTDDSVLQAALADNPNVKVVGRKGGHSIVMDDGDVVGNDQLIRIRTALGHQILMSDNGQTLMILHSNGQSYIELGKEGTIDMFSTNSVNIRTQGDLNLHADNDVNINAAKKLNIQADSITVSSEKDYKQRVGGDNIIQTLGKFTHKVGGAMSMAASGVASYSSSLVTFINGLFVNLNTGQTYVIPKEVPIPTNVAHTDTLYDKAKGFLAAPGKLISIVSRAPAHAPWANAGQGVNIPTTLNADAQLSSAPSSPLSLLNKFAEGTPIAQVTNAVASTVPAIGPISSLIGYGETSALLGAISTNVGSSAANFAASVGGGIVQTAQGAVPVLGKLGLTPQQLQDSSCIKPGSAPLVMSLAQNPGATLAKVLPKNLFTGNKPGGESAAQLADNIDAQAKIAVEGLQRGQIALTQVGVMTGKEAPADVAGVILAGATAGVAPVIDAYNEAATTVNKAVTTAQGVVATGQNLVNTAQGAIGTVQNIGRSLTTITNFTAKVPALGGLTDSFAGLSSNFSSITSTIGSGNFAASLGAVGGAFSAISGFLGKLGGGISNIINRAKGIAADAFNSIKNALPTLKPGVPQNLEAINASAKAAESAAAATSNTSAAATDTVAGVTGIAAAGAAVAGAVAGATRSSNSLLSSVSGALDTIKTTVTTAINSAGSVVTNAANKLAGAFTTTNTTSGANSAIASGVDMIPGGQNAISSITDYSNNEAATAILGTGSIKAVVDSASTAAINGISLSGAISSAINSVSSLTTIGKSISSIASSVTGFLSSGLDKLKSLGLSALVQAGLPAVAAAKLNSAISGLSSSFVKIVTPQVGVNTTDRSQINDQTKALLGNVPAPNLTGTVSDSATAALNTIEEKNNKINAVIKQIDDLIIERDNVEINFNLLQRQYRDLANSSPQGDPRVASARKTAENSLEEVESLNKKILALRKQQYALQGITRPINTGNPERDQTRELLSGTASVLTTLRNNL